MGHMKTTEVAYFIANPFSDLFNADCFNLPVCWNDKGPGIYIPELSTFGGGLFGLQFRIGLSTNGTGNLIFDRKIQIKIG